MIVISQNKSGHDVFYKNHRVHDGYIYGEADGTFFVTEPKIKNQTMPMIIRSMRSNWIKKSDPVIVSEIIKAFRADAVILYAWKEDDENKKAQLQRKAVQDMKSYREAASCQKNNEGAIRRFHQRMPFNRRNSFATSEYMQASYRLYGETLEVSRKTISMSSKMSEYMDGNTTEGYRPLNPQLPVKSGKRK